MARWIGIQSRYPARSRSTHASANGGSLIAQSTSTSGIPGLSHLRIAEKSSSSAAESWKGWPGTAIMLIPPSGRSAVLADDLEAVDLVEPLSLPRIVPEDADDDQVIAAAVAAHAHMIVSGDRHLLALRAFEAIEIVTAAAAIERLLTS